MRCRFTYTLLAAIAGVLLLGSPAFAHRARPTAASAVRPRYQAVPRAHPDDEARSAHRAAEGRGKARLERSARGDVRQRRNVKAARLRGKAASRRVRTAGRKTRAPVAAAKTETGPKTAAAAVFAPKEDVASSVAVVSVIRHDGVRPQLEGIEEAAARTEILPDLYDERGRLNLIPSLKGSHEILVRQNQMADLDGLSRVTDDDDLLRMRETKMLVALPVNSGLRVDERLAWNRRFCRPWVAQFLTAIGQAHYGEFHRALQVNSAVRTISFQTRLMRTNGNAAQTDGDAASPHLTGQAIDLAKKGLSTAEIAWMRLYLTRLVEEGRIDVEEEFQQACFHVSIYKRYAPEGVAPQKIAATHRTLTPALAALE